MSSGGLGALWPLEPPCCFFLPRSLLCHPFSLLPLLPSPSLDQLCHVLTLGPLPGDCCPVGLCVASIVLSHGSLGRGEPGREVGLQIPGSVLPRPATPPTGQGWLSQSAPPTNHRTAKQTLAGLLASGLGIVGGGPRPQWRHPLVSGSQEPRSAWPDEHWIVAFL